MLVALLLLLVFTLRTTVVSIFSRDLGRLPGLSVKLLLISRLSRTVLTLSPPPVLSHLSSNPSHLLLLEPTLMMDPMLL